MPDTFTETLRAVALNIGVPALIVFWYACRVRHPARPRWQAFLMALAVLATVPAATLAGLHYAITVRDGSPLILIPVGIALPFVLRAIVRAWLRSAPRRRARPRSIRSQPGRGCHPEGRSAAEDGAAVDTPGTRRLSGRFSLVPSQSSHSRHRLPVSGNVGRPLAGGWSEPVQHQPATLPSCHNPGTIGP